MWRLVILRVAKRYNSSGGGGGVLSDPYFISTPPDGFLVRQFFVLFCGSSSPLRSTNGLETPL